MADEGESDGRSVLTPSRELLSTRLWLSLISCRQVKKVGRRSERSCAPPGVDSSSKCKSAAARTDMGSEIFAAGISIRAVAADAESAGDCDQSPPDCD